MTEIPLAGPDRGRGFALPGDRTFGITLIVFIHIILGIITFALAGITMSFELEGVFLSLIIIALIAGLFYWISAFGLWTMQSWSWICAIFTNIFMIGCLIWGAMAIGMPIWAGIAQIVFGVLIIFYLILPNTRELLGAPI
ncbi:MAG: hypothetical protein ACFE7R_03750 [Candidatus Hodarchaeota archaeon]